MWSFECLLLRAVIGSHWDNHQGTGVVEKPLHPGTSGMVGITQYLATLIVLTFLLIHN